MEHTLNTQTKPSAKNETTSEFLCKPEVESVIKNTIRGIIKTSLVVLAVYGLALGAILGIVFTLWP